MTSAKRPSRYRLTPEVRPSLYDLHLRPDLESGDFVGEVEIELDVDSTRRSIDLHAADLEVENATVTSDGSTRAAEVEVRAADQVWRVRTGGPIAAGSVRLHFSFRGRLGTQLRGFYAVHAKGRRYAFTQLEAADARRVFPCFDEPGFKARFRIAVSARKDDVVLSNEPIEAESAAGRGWRRVQFGTTPKLSTYLLAIAVGPLVSSPPRRLGSTEIRAWFPPGGEGLTSFALEAASESLARLEAYFAIPYPYTKLDLVAVPDFEAGAMENAGAVFFRETLLLLDLDTASLAERKRAAEVIAHELAHMWYGNLVTMQWWDDLWLNEAFATWMAYRVIDDWKPEWRMWNSFEHDRASALALDALANTHSIYTEVQSVSQATENFDLITYEKGAACVRMIENYLGGAAFRDGVRRYMRKHRESNAVAEDLWNALEAASGRDVARVAKAWITQPGFPLLTLKRGRSGYRIEQERFFSNPKGREKATPSKWPVPMVLRTGSGKSETARLLVTRRKVSESYGDGAKPDWVFGNADASGFYRVAHDDETLARLLDGLSGKLAPAERMALIGDQWALLRAGRTEVGAFLDVVEALGDETTHDVLDALVGPLSIIDDQVLAPGSRTQQRYRQWICTRFRPALDKLGWSSKHREGDAARLRRAALLRLVALVGEDPEWSEAARTRFDAYVDDRGELDPNLADAVVATTARDGDYATYQQFRELVSGATTPQERRRFLLQLSTFRDARATRSVLAACRGGEIPTQDLAFVLVRLFGNPAARERTWDFVRKHWVALRKRIPPLMVSRLIEATPALRDAQRAREVSAFFRAHPVAEADRALKQAREVFRLNAELRRRAAPGVRAWLREHPKTG